jgi:uncharacterized ferritin-like protein (DUF455 family)
MNVTEYAERVLFGTDLEEKLALTTHTVEFDDQQAKIFSQVVPGRPDSLQFSSRQSSRIALPARPALVNERSRGILLHFFANHELLAAELMALALLKFPGAPLAFREGLFRTLQEEQKHTRWYLGRMKECGVSLGEFPVSRFFWDTVSPMETPLDYVSRLSLTFEQANLDYSRHFGAVMAEAGDARTARIMNKIYQDEIEHVGYGLKWFRHWKDPAQSDWEVYRRQLSLPLSPSRAKGNGVQFNEAGRAQAGLTSDFIRQLAVYEKSKGRTPNIFCFNPEAEDRIAAYLKSSDPQTLNSSTQALITDLEILQIFLSRQDDVITMRKPPSLPHLERLRSAGFQLPEIEALDAHGNLCPDTTLTHRKINAIRPWSVSPDLPARFAGITGHPLWESRWADLFSKTRQAAVFGEWMPGSQICCSISEVCQALLQNEAVVLKRPVSSAGRGVKFCQTRTQAIATAEKWLAETPAILVEPSHQRVFDFSVQYEVSPGKITQIGLIRQVVDAAGRYRGSISAAKFCKGLPGELSRLLMNEALPFYDTSSPMIQALHAWFQHCGFAGAIGIDAYIYRSDRGLALRPICEINPRHTMGRITHEIRQAISPGCSVKFEIVKPHPDLAPGKPVIHPATGKICGGNLCLNELSSASHFAAKITVAKDPVNF